MTPNAPQPVRTRHAPPSDNVQAGLINILNRWKFQRRENQGATEAGRGEMTGHCAISAKCKVPTGRTRTHSHHQRRLFPPLPGPLNALPITGQNWLRRHCCSTLRQATKAGWGRLRP